MLGRDSSWRLGVHLTDTLRASSTISGVNILGLFIVARKASSAILGVNSFTPIRVRAGTKTSRPVGFLQ